jgi:hypothetical protein
MISLHTITAQGNNRIALSLTPAAIKRRREEERKLETERAKR